MYPYSLLWEYVCDGSVISVAATPNCSTIAAATVGQSVILLDGDGNALWAKPFETDFEAWTTDISADGQFVAVGTASKNPANGSIFVLDREQRLLWTVRLHSPVWSVSLSADGQTLAASTWTDNTLYIFRREGSEFILVSERRVPGEHGLYGVKLTPNAQLCLVASYESGLYLLEQSGAIVSKLELSEGLYNVAIAPANNCAFAGSRSGAIVMYQLESEGGLDACKPISSRPICGVSVTDDGALIATGSFDGRVILSNTAGDTLWDHQTKGEVWTTAISSNGAFVCAGSGDHKVRLFQNFCDVSAYKEIRAMEDSLKASSPTSLDTRLQTLTKLYLKYGLVNYGQGQLSTIQRQHPDAHIFKQELKEFLKLAVESPNSSEDSHFQYAQLLSGEQNFSQAVRHFQLAASKPSLRSLANRHAAECFAEMRFTTAATSAWRQSREQHLSESARHILFSLARSYEDLGEWREASKIYELIVSWDVDFRNALEKLMLAKRFQSMGALDASRVQADYTGATASLLGPDAPREVDSALESVVAARSREILINAGQRQTVKDIVSRLLGDKIFSSGIRRDVGHLEYDIELFLKYDFGLPEDEMKKFLETVNAAPYFTRPFKSSGVKTSLDIGSATGRYPSLLTTMNFQATGIDIEPRAIEFSRRKSADPDWPRYICGDGCEMDDLLDPTERFDVITCMMGTFQHLSFAAQAQLVRHMFQRLKRGGVCIVSVWDVECSHLAYLSMYDENQKDRIHQNSRTREGTKQLFKESGFKEVNIIPFCLLPQTVIYDLGISGMNAEDINIAAQADLATRALFGDQHGEMFLAIGEKGQAEDEI